MSEGRLSMRKREKISLAKRHLYMQDGSYVDFIKEEIAFQFFENGWVDNFVENLKSEEEITEKLDLIINKMIMHEHEAGLIDILESYM